MYLPSFFYLFLYFCNCDRDVVLIEVFIGLPLLLTGYYYFEFEEFEESVIGLAPRVVVWHPGWLNWVAKPGWRVRAIIGLPRVF